EVARHAGERQDVSRSSRFLHLDQRADDLVHVTARREVFARAGDDYRAHVRHIGEGAKRLGELTIRVERERVLSLGPVQRDDGDATGEVPAKVTRANGGDVDADWGH